MTYKIGFLPLDPAPPPGIWGGTTSAQTGELLREHGLRRGLREISAFPSSRVSKRAFELQQVHGAKVLSTDELRGWKMLAEGDGLITTHPGEVIAIKTADCLPVFMVSKDTRVIGLLHAGWRGAVLGIGLVGLRRFEELGVPAGEVLVWLGPSISGTNYEVGPEVVTLASLLDERAAGMATLPPKAGRPKDRRRFDVATFQREVLIHAGVPAENVHQFGGCTFENGNLASYRRDGKAAGRMYSVLAIQA